MTLALVSGCVWVLAAAVTATLPMRRQMAPGLALLIAAPVLIAWIGAEAGWLAAALGLFAFASMFRRPLLHLARRVGGRAA